MMSPADRLAELRADARLLAEIAATRARVEWLVRRYPIDRCTELLTRARPADAADPGEIERIGRLTARTLHNRRRPRNTCLHRALTRLAMLHRRGAAPVFRMGLRPGADIEGHAWIELDGLPWMEETLTELVTTFEFTAPHPPSRPER